jgi:hypothetical protein
MRKGLYIQLRSDAGRTEAETRVIPDSYLTRSQLLVKQCLAKEAGGGRKVRSNA